MRIVTAPCGCRVNVPSDQDLCTIDFCKKHRSQEVKPDSLNVIDYLTLENMNLVDISRTLSLILESIDNWKRINEVETMIIKVLKEKS